MPTASTELSKSVKDYAPKIVEEICAIPECLIVEAALIFGKAKNVLSLWSMGVNQSSVGVHKNNAINNLHLVTGKIGKPGCGPFSLTGQPNAMGGREVGGLSHMLPGYRSVQNSQHREEVEKRLGAGRWAVLRAAWLTGARAVRSAGAGKSESNLDSLH